MSNDNKVVNGILISNSEGDYYDFADKDLRDIYSKITECDYTIEPGINIDPTNSYINYITPTDPTNKIHQINIETLLSKFIKTISYSHYQGETIVLEKNPFTVPFISGVTKLIIYFNAVGTLTFPFDISINDTSYSCMYKKTNTIMAEKKPTTIRTGDIVTLTWFKGENIEGFWYADLQEPS